VAVVPGRWKAKAVQLCLEGEVRAEAPAPILRAASEYDRFLDEDSASPLSTDVWNELSKSGRVTVGP